jgi:hypothetical protein
MSLAEIKTEIQRMTLRERAEIQRYFRALRWQEDPAMPGRIDAAQQRMDSGRKVSAEEVDARIARARAARG